MTVEIKTIKSGYSSFLVKLKITREVFFFCCFFFVFFLNQRVLFNPYIHKVLSHVKSPRTLHIYERYDC